MTDEQVIEAWEAAKKSVKVSCDENHAHSARQRCLSGDPKSIAICQLAETLLGERKLVRDAATKLGTASTKIGNM